MRWRECLTYRKGGRSMSDFSLKDMVKFIIKHVKLIVICALIITVVGCVYVNICQTYKASIMIEYDYYGIEEGKNPLGGKLNVYEIMSPTVVENAIKSLGLRENVDEIRNSITITPVVDDKTSEKIKATSEKGEDYEFFPSTYAITYDYPAAYGSDHGKFVLNKILQAYDELFIRNYTGTKTLPDVLNTVDYSGYDYLEVCDLIYNQIDNAKNFLGVMDKNFGNMSREF